jgi:SAM-dependent methyltransferase
MMFDWERGALIRMIEQCVGAQGETTRLLDVGCGYGRNFDTTKKLCGTCIGVDINPDIVLANKERGFECYVPEELSRDGLKFDIILMSHVIEHFSPDNLLEFMDGYLDLLRPGGHLIVATPLMSPYFYDDFDHIKPYQPLGMLMMFGPKGAQVQYHSRHELVLSDLWFRRSYYRVSYRRSRYIKTTLSRIAILLEFISALASFVFMGRLGRVDGWMGMFRKI